MLVSCSQVLQSREQNRSAKSVQRLVSPAVVVKMLKLLFLVAFVASVSAMRFDKGFFMDTISMSEDRIIGGLEGENDQFPYQVLLFTGNHYFCGGSIIAKRFILTAAQCTQGNLSSPSNVIAIVGYPKNEKHYELSKIKNHPKYKPGKLANDISVLRTKKSIVFDDFVQRIALPTADVSEGNVSATVSGYGQYRVSIQFSPSGVSFSVCKKCSQNCSTATEMFQIIFHLNCNGQTP